MGNSGEVSDSPSPVMTFEAGGRWLAVRVDQVDRVAVASRLWPVPLASRFHAGLFDSGSELVPVMRLDDTTSPDGAEQLLALLHVRGATVGLAIDRAGRVYERWSREDTRDTAPDVIAAAGALPARSSDHHFWLVDTDRLFDVPEGTPFSATPSRGP